ncbi:MAG: hypothetical protein AB1429_02895 [Pseudomonadota bacterium]|jgi:uncharacterized protein YjbI with pentapeptide repeats
MAEDEDAAEAERDRLWWEGWWAMDFSWNNLINHPIGDDERAVGAHGERNLQDYWRRDGQSGAVRTDEDMIGAGELVHLPDGQLWHIAHAPLTWRNGDAAKSGWDEAKWTALAKLVAARLRAGEETPIQPYGRLYGSDRRTQLQGSILRRLPAIADRALHIVASWARFLSDTDLRAQDFGPGAVFERAFFTGGAAFERASFSGFANFGSATFSRDTVFWSATVSGFAYFESATFYGHAFFGSTTFSDVAFWSTTFSGDAVFENATFCGDADFRGATFSRFASFAGRASGVAKGEDVQSIEGRAKPEAGMPDDFEFSGAIVSKAGLEPRARCAFVSADFEGAVFGDDANFGNREFLGVARFNRTIWRGRPIFHQSKLSQDASFRNARFPVLEASLWKVWFPPAVAIRNLIRLRLCLRSIPGARQRLSELFRKALDERKEKFQSIDAFDEIHYRQNRAEADQRRGWRSRRFSRRWAFLLIDVEKRRSAIDESYGRLESDFRTLKLAMENVRARQEEARFFRLELIARRRRPMWSEVSPFERLASYVYAGLADYGLSIVRPVAWLAGLVGSVTLGGWIAMKGSLDAVCATLRPTPWGLDPDLREAMSFAMFNIVRPGAVWDPKTFDSTDSDPSAWPQKLAALHPTLIKLIATAETTAAAVLIFLFFLAVRRRFQIS